MQCLVLTMRHGSGSESTNDHTDGDDNQLRLEVHFES